MVIKLLGLVPVVNSRDNEKINSGTMQRYLAEIVWFPSAALSPYITWEGIDDVSARATMSFKGTTTSGIFRFDENGDFHQFTTLRYLGSDENAVKKEWVITADESKVISGIRIPTRMRVSWKLDQGEWNWLQLEITDIAYNQPAPTSS